MGWPMLILGIIGIITGGSLLFGKLYLAGILFLVFAMFLLAGLKRVHEQERWVIELFGKYLMILRPGLGWILLEFMRTRAVVSVWEQTVPLFAKQIEIDFKCGGQAIPNGAEAFVKMKNPDTPYDAGDGKKRNGACRAIYEIANWKIATQRLIENASRSFLNGKTIDEAIIMAKAGYDLTTPAPGDPESALPNHEIERIRKDLAVWGFELLRITITDFDLTKETAEARGKVQISQKEAEAAVFKRQEVARETVGALIQMIAEALGEDFETVQKKVRGDPELQKTIISFAQELITRQMSIDGEVLSDIRVAGGGDIVNGVLAIIAALNQGKRSEKKKRKKEGEEEEEGEEE